MTNEECGQSELGQKRFTLGRLMQFIAMLAVCFALSGSLGVAFLASVLTGTCIAVFAGVIIGIWRDDIRECIGGGIVGAFATHLIVLWTSFISFDFTGKQHPWSLAGYMLLVPVGAFCGAAIAAASARSKSCVRPLVAGLLVGPMLGVLWGVVDSSHELNPRYLTALELWLPRNPAQAVVWALTGLAFGGLLGGVWSFVSFMRRFSRPCPMNDVERQVRVVTRIREPA